MPWTDLSLDLETLAKKPTAAILSIGWCPFNFEGLGVAKKVNVDLDSCLAAGLEVDASTVRWWMDQGDAARRALYSPAPILLLDALQRFTGLFMLTMVGNRLRVWAKPATFDVPILENAYHAMGLEVPWFHRATRCLRTLNEEARLLGIPAYPGEFAGEKHDAAADALYQAQSIRYLRKELAKRRK